MYPPPYLLTAHACASLRAPLTLLTTPHPGTPPHTPGDQQLRLMRLPHLAPQHPPPTLPLAHASFPSLPPTHLVTNSCGSCACLDSPHSTLPATPPLAHASFPSLTPHTPCHQQLRVRPLVAAYCVLDHGQYGGGAVQLAQLGQAQPPRLQPPGQPLDVGQACGGKGSGLNTLGVLIGGQVLRGQGFSVRGGG